MHHAIKEKTSLRREQVRELSRYAEFGKLSAGIFHDLMNYLNAVISNVECAEKLSDQKTETARCIRRAVEASRRMGELFGMIRKHIRAENTDEWFSLDTELDEAVKILNCRIVRSGVMVCLRNSAKLETFGNRLKFHQVALNLIGNAIDACQDKADAESRISITLEQREEVACLSVADNGSGIDPSYLGRLFEPFFTTKDPCRGLGLGLAIVKGIIEQDFHGTISVESALGRGTTFKIAFPIMQGAIS